MKPPQDDLADDPELLSSLLAAAAPAIDEPTTMSLRNSNPFWRRAGGPPPS